MAECSYVRCLQERRNIKRELSKWTKNMVYIVGLERVAEELMGRRKWKLYQEVLTLSRPPLSISESTTQQPPPATVEETSSSTTTTTTRTTIKQETNQTITEQTNHIPDQIQKSTSTGIPPPPRNCTTDVPPPEEYRNHSQEVDQEKTIIPSNQEERNYSLAENILGSIVKQEDKLESITEDKVTEVEETSSVLEAEAPESVSTIVKTEVCEHQEKSEEESAVLDWKPQEKCYFCVDGKLLRVNASGALVTNKGTNDGDIGSASATSPHDSDSESSSTTSEPDITPHPYPLPPGISPKTFSDLLQQNSQMASLETVQSMAASIAAVAALSNPGNLQNPNTLAGLSGIPFYPPFGAQWYLAAQHSRNFLPERLAQEFSEKVMATTPPETQNAEQPLDLSAKSGSATPTGSDSSKMQQNLRMTSYDSKHIYKAKPRMSGLGSRRTYTEDELQAALRDIQSGKLGTRRAAVIYGIPRSTLRNKVYKLAMEREREAHLLPSLAGALPPSLITPIALANLTNPSSSTPDIKLEDDDLNDDDKELSGAEEEKEVEKELQRPLLSMDDILRFSQIDNSALAASENLRHLLQKGGSKFFDSGSPKAEGSGPDIWAGIEHSPFAPYIQSLLMAGNLGRSQSHKPEESSLPELMNLIAEEQMKHEHVNNGKSNEMDEEMAKRLLARQNSASSGVIMRSDRRKTETPEGPIEMINEDDSASNVILKIPSFKPVAGAQSLPNNIPKTSGSEREAGSSSLQQQQQQFYNRNIIMDPSVSNQMSQLSVISPPIASGIRGSNTSESNSPPILPGKNIVSLREVIAKSISQKFQQGSSQNHEVPQKHSSPNLEALESLNAYKRGRITPPMNQGISVIKNLGHDMSRSFGSSQNTSNNSSNQPGGKGTRPKRGKYRNYDRDSLVEAVKAVQRGEMSVHRAGSYYGVPHSTLEYKVKERHLMRPRKREPKPQPVEEKSSTSSIKPSDIPGANILRPDKGKVMPKPPIKGPFPPNSPNGLKMPGMFDPNLAQLGYSPPFPFWPHAPPFPGLQLDFSRNPPGAFPPNPESFFASQMMQRLQEGQSRHPPTTPTPSTSSKASIQNQASVTKNPRELAESLYDGTGVNGSFLDGIIRSSLEMGLPNHRNKQVDPNGNTALLDQLVRNNKTPLPRDPQSSGDESNVNPKSPANYAMKRSGSPLNFPQDSKRYIDPGRHKFSPAGRTSPINYSDKHIPGSMNVLPRNSPSPRHNIPDKSMGYSRDKLKIQEYLHDRPGFLHGKLNPYIKEEVPTVELSNDSTDSERKRKASTDDERFSSSPINESLSLHKNSQMRAVQILQENMKISEEMKEIERRREVHEKSRRKTSETYKYHENVDDVMEHNGTEDASSVSGFKQEVLSPEHHEDL